MCSASIRAPGAGALLAARRVCGRVEQLARERVEVPGVEWKLPEAGVVARHPSVPLRTPTGPAPGPRLSSTLPRTERAWRPWMLRKGTRLKPLTQPCQTVTTACGGRRPREPE